MRVDRLLPTAEAADLISLARDIADKVLTPIVDAHEKAESYPEGVFAQLGAAGLLSLPQPEEWGGGGQPFEVYLQVLEEIAARWAAIAVAVSVHGLSIHPLLTFGTDEQKRRWLPGMLSGEQIGAYSLSEPHAGSDAAALRCSAVPTGDGAYVINGSKSWITHGGRADFYRLFARRQPRCLVFSDPRRPDRAVLRQAGGEDGPARGAYHLSVLRPRPRRSGPAGRRAGPGPADRIFGAGLRATRHRRGGRRSGPGRTRRDRRLRQPANDVRPQDHHQGLGFLLADMAAAVTSARATYLDAARRRDAGRPYSTQASVAKLIATDAAMKVTTDAVQVLGGAGYTRDYRVERYMREAKIMQIFEGTNQIQRLVIARALTTK